MPKITFMGAGSTVFARNVLGDSMLTPALEDSVISLYDIDPQRLKESEMMLTAINNNLGGKAEIEAWCGVENRRAALRGANYVVNAIQVGFYKPCTVTDFEIPKKYGLRQTIGDTLGIGGIFRALRTIPVMFDFARDMEEVCPDAWFLNYTNPMAMLTGAMQRFTGVKTVGLCHSVQHCVPKLMERVGMEYDSRVQWKIAGINHQAWLLEVTKDGEDLYPEIKRRCAAITEKHDDMRDELTRNPNLTHTRSNEYASRIMEAMEINEPYKFGGNVLNTGLITNLPQDACVEVACFADASGVTPAFVGALPEQCAAMNRTNINVQLLTILAAVTLKKDYIYQAAMMDPHCQSELSIDDIVAMCDDLIEAHRGWLPEYH